MLSCRAVLCLPLPEGEPKESERGVLLTQPVAATKLDFSLVSVA